MTYALIAYALAQLADVVTTLRFLQRGGREANPVIAWLMDRLGRGWIVAKLAMGGGAAWLAHDAGMVWLIWALAGLVALIAARNETVAR